MHVRNERQIRSGPWASGMIFVLLFAEFGAEAMAQLPKSIVQALKFPCKGEYSGTAPIPVIRAASRIQDAIKAVPDPATAAEMRGYENTLRAFVEGANPENVQLAVRAYAELTLAITYERLDRPQEAAEHLALAAAAEADPRNDLSGRYYVGLHHIQRGVLLQEIGRNEEALAAFQSAQRLGCVGLEKNISDLSAQIAFAQRITRDAQERGAVAEEKGEVREALGIYAKALGEIALAGLPPFLVAKAIDAAAKLNPPPPIPEEARKHAVFAQTAFKNAQTTADLYEAQNEYQRALALAPWWADAWVTLSAVHEKLGNFAAAVSDLENYLRAAPRAPDRDEVQNKIYELQFKAKQ